MFEYGDNVLFLKLNLFQYKYMIMLIVYKQSEFFFVFEKLKIVNKHLNKQTNQTVNLNSVYKQEL